MKGKKVRQDFHSFEEYHHIQTNEELSTNQLHTEGEKITFVPAPDKRRRFFLSSGIILLLGMGCALKLLFDFLSGPNHLPWIPLSWVSIFIAVVLFSA